MLLAVDLGLKTAWSQWDSDGSLVSFGSRAFPNRSKMKSGVPSILRGLTKPEIMICEGDPRLAKIWFSFFPDCETELVQAQTWRPSLFPSRLRRSGSQAKANAISLAERLVRLDSCGRGNRLNHDTAEAVLLGYWAVTQRGWRPDEL